MSQSFSKMLSEYGGKTLTAAEISLVQIFERREEAYKLAEQQRLDELKLVNESIASMINPAAAAAPAAAETTESTSGEAAVAAQASADAPGEEAAVGGDDKEEGNDEGGGEGEGGGMLEAYMNSVREEDPDKYKDLSKMAANASAAVQDALAKKSSAKRKYDITASPPHDGGDGADGAREKEKERGGLRKMKKKAMRREGEKEKEKEREGACWKRT